MRYALCRCERNVNASVASKAEAIDYMTRLMEKSGNLNDREAYKKGVLAREEEGTTGIGDGIAIPHSKCAAVKRAGLAAMVVKDGVDYESLDDEPADLIFMIAAPETGANVHLEALARLSTILMDTEFKESLVKAETAEQFIRLIDEKEDALDGKNKQKAMEESKDGYRVLAITACPTGIAHTFMAAESLDMKGKELGISIKVETQGADGAIGEVKMVQVNFGSCKEYDVKNRFFSKELAGGALLDIGVYATSFARYFMKSRPDVVLTTANYFETGVDETSGILLKNPDGEMAVMALTMRAKQPKRGVVAGEKGFIEINNYPRACKAAITYTEDGRTEVVEAGRTEDALQYEVQDMQEYVSSQGGKENLRIVRDVMQTLTAVRNQWGMVYPFE